MKMWRCKKTKKPVYAQITDLIDIDKNGDGEMCFETIKSYNCDGWRYPIEMDLEELKKRAEWVEDNEQRD